MDECPHWTNEQPCDDPVSDGVLLGRFVERGDGEAFAELVGRYGGLVWAVCRRILRDEQDAEDAFQATFLVLARRAARIRKRSNLAAWLHSVAYRSACRANARRHRRCEQELREEMMASDDTLATVANRYEQQLLHEELDRLPAKYREPLVLRYLIGKPNEEVARELGLSVGVVEGRIRRGKDRLRSRLAKRGISVAVALTTAHVCQSSEAATLGPLVRATAEAAVAFRNGAHTSAHCSQGAIQLAHKELTMISTTTLTPSTVAAAFAMVGLSIALAGAAAQPPATHRGRQIPVTPVTAPSQPYGKATMHLGDGHESMMSGMAGMAPPETNGKVGARLGMSVALEGGRRAVLDLKQRTPVEQRIFAALDSETHLEFVETPLEDAVQFLKEQHDIPIELDLKALSDEGIPVDVPITRSLEGIRLRSALWLMLRDWGLTYVVQGEVLLITTQTVADDLMEIHVYDLRELGDIDSEMLADVIQRTIRPGTWDPSDRENCGAIRSLPGCLVVIHNPRVHEMIADLLTQLQQFNLRFDSSSKHMELHMELMDTGASQPNGGADDLPPRSDQR